MHKLVHDPGEVLRTEAEMHVSAWVKLGHVISPIGYLEAHDITGTPAMLVLEVGMYVRVGRWLITAGTLHLNILRFLS